MHIDSIDVAKASVKLSISSREEEHELRDEYMKKGIRTAAVDVGGNILNSIPKIIESALVASKRTGVIKDCFVHDGAVAGAARDALMQISQKANGLSVGGKIGIARSGENLSVCIFMSIGLLNFNEVAIGLGHRSIPDIY